MSGNGPLQQIHKHIVAVIFPPAGKTCITFICLPSRYFFGHPIQGLVAPELTLDNMKPLLIVLDDWEGRIRSTGCWDQVKAWRNQIFEEFAQIACMQLREYLEGTLDPAELVS